MDFRSVADDFGLRRRTARRRNRGSVRRGPDLGLSHWQPSESMNLADVYANGSLLVSVGNGAAIYRDVPPGRYHLAPDSFVPNSMQDATIELAPGQQAYIKIVSL